MKKQKKIRVSEEVIVECENCGNDVVLTRYGNERTASGRCNNCNTDIEVDI